MCAGGHCAGILKQQLWFTASSLSRQYLDALGFELRWRALVREKSIAPTGSPAAKSAAFAHQALQSPRNFLSVCRI